MKKCSTCKIFKSLNKFYRSSDKKDGYKSQCKNCHNLTAHTHRIYKKGEYLIRRKRPRYFLDDTYRHMKRRVSGQNSWKTSAEGKKLTIDSKAFKDWSLKETNFLQLFADYISSNFDRKLAPSIDRIDIKGGYELGNMQWLTLSENIRKYHLVDKYNY